jgi:hypothetical protein
MITLRELAGMFVVVALFAGVVAICGGFPQ